MLAPMAAVGVASLGRGRFLREVRLTISALQRAESPGLVVSGSVELDCSGNPAVTRGERRSLVCLPSL